MPVDGISLFHIYGILQEDTYLGYQQNPKWLQHINNLLWLSGITNAIMVFTQNGVET